MIFSLLLSSLLTFVELNCENLFDTVHDSLKNDMEFTPEGSYRWTRTRYWRKLNGLAKEIIALGEPQDTAAASRPENVHAWQLPDLVALCEVENDSVMIALTRRSLLRSAGYEYVMTDSPDARGIDVALMYQPSSFRLLRSYPLRIVPMEGMRATRDILYACGQTADGDSLHVFVVHAPSRRGGEQTSRPYRLHVAQRLGESVDSVRALCRDANIIVAGDFNDYSDSPALLLLSSRYLLSEVSDGAKGRNGAHATYRWHGDWRSLDHIFCSHALARRVEDCCIGDLPFLLEDDSKYGGKKPFRTYLGPRYLGGFSDHLPLVLRLRQ